MGVRKYPYRELLGRWNARQIHQFGESVGKRLKALDDENIHQSSGLISGSKLGQPALWTVLQILGEGKDFDEYTLGKFQRGHDVEARTINFMTGVPLQQLVDILDGVVENPGWISITDERAVLSGEIYLQYEASYRGGIGYVDLAQRTPNGQIVFHEIKSSTKMAFDKVAATGRSSAGTPAPYDHHSLQLASYCLGEDVSTGFIHYMNADDYRVCSFSINPLDYQEEIDKEYDDVQAAFLTKTLPVFETLFDFHKIAAYQTFGDEWNLLSPSQALTKLEMEYPKSFEMFMNTTLPTNRKEMEEYRKKRKAEYDKEERN